MLSATLSFLCDPQPTTYRATTPPNCGCCHCRPSLAASPPPPHYYASAQDAAWWYHQRNHELEYWHHLPRQMVADSDELASIHHMKRSLALLRESVNNLPASSTSTTNSSKQSIATAAAAAAAQAALVIEAMTGGKRDRTSRLNHAPTRCNPVPSVPVSALFRTIRKQRTQPQHQCCQCGTTNTSQWRNSPTGQKLCNPCGMKLWRRKKQGPAMETTRSAKSSEQARPVELEEEDEEDEFAPRDRDGRRRSNIYTLLN